MSKRPTPEEMKEAKRKYQKAPPGKCSWTGLEDERNRIHSVCHHINSSHAAFRAICTSDIQAVGIIAEAMRDMSTAPHPLVQTAASAQLELKALVAALVNEHGLDWDVVMGEALPLLNPTDEERERCRKMIEKVQKRRNRYDQKNNI